MANPQLLPFSVAAPLGLLAFPSHDPCASTLQYKERERANEVVAGADDGSFSAINAPKNNWEFFCNFEVRLDPIPTSIVARSIR